MMRMSDMVKHLLIINIIFFVGTMLVPEAQKLFALYYFENQNFRIWQPLTHMFMHGGIGHIFFNMFALISFGSVLESYWGSKKFLFFYFSCGIGAMLLHTGVNYIEFTSAKNILLDNGVTLEGINTLLQGGSISINSEDSLMLQRNINDMAMAYDVPVLGASGAIYGLLAAFAFMFPNAELALMFIPVPIKAKYFVPGWILLFDVIYGIFGTSLGFGTSGFGHFAHLGGALIGFIMVYFWNKNQFDKNRWDR